MKTLILAATALAMSFSVTLPTNAATAPDGAYANALVAGSATVDKRRPRVPGGSGCDSIRDLLEHPECR